MKEEITKEWLEDNAQGIILISFVVFSFFFLLGLIILTSNL
jgi:maltodextrin utilization protein YvdJ